MCARVYATRGCKHAVTTCIVYIYIYLDYKRLTKYESERSKLGGGEELLACFVVNPALYIYMYVYIYACVLCIVG